MKKTGRGERVAAVVIGGVVALSAKSSYDSVASECPAAGCTQSAFDTRTSARTRGDAATAVMIAGGVVAAGGILMIALSPDVATVPRIGLGPRGVQLAVGF